MNFSGVILAGGASKRMGRDKAWLEVGGQSLLARQVQLLRGIGASEVFISGRAGGDYPVPGCRVLADRIPGAGPLAGIEAALTAAASPRVLVLAVDMPHMTAEVLGRIVGHSADATGTVPCVGGAIEPLAAVYARPALALVTAFLSHGEGGRSPGARAFAEQCVTSGLARFLEFSTAEAPAFANWNSPADLDPTGNQRTARS